MLFLLKIFNKNFFFGIRKTNTACLGEKLEIPIRFGFRKWSCNRLGLIKECLIMNDLFGNSLVWKRWQRLLFQKCLKSGKDWGTTVEPETCIKLPKKSLR